MDRAFAVGTAQAGFAVQVAETNPLASTPRAELRNDHTAGSSAVLGDSRNSRDTASSQAGRDARPADAQPMDVTTNDAQPNDAIDAVADLDVDRLFALARSGSFDPSRWTPILIARDPNRVDPARFALDGRRERNFFSRGSVEVRFDARPGPNQLPKTPNPANPLERLMIAPFGGVGSSPVSGSFSTSSGGSSAAAPTLLSALALHDTWRSLWQSALLRPPDVALRNLAPPG
jgi:hypothetical protein